MSKNIGYGVRAAILIGLVILAGMSEITERKSIQQGLNETVKELSQEIEKELKDARLEDMLSVSVNFAKKKIQEISFYELGTKYGLPAAKEYVIQLLSAKSPHKNDIAQVINENKILKPGRSLEGEFLVNRTRKVQAALANFLNSYSIPIDAVPKIACAFSGGGYRAMVITAGFMKALQDLGLLDAITYVSSLSGSTWYVGPWTLMQQPNNNKFVSIDEFNQLLRDKIKADTFDLKGSGNRNSLSFLRLANDVIFPKVVFGQVVSSVDLYGALLAHALLSDFGDMQQRQHLSNQWFSVQQGNNPWPLYTAVSMAKDNGGLYQYNWYEFTPEEVRNLETGLAIPSFAFGRRFENGKSVDFAPEQSFGFQMGIFGSAYTINLQDMRSMINTSAGPITQAEEIEANNIIFGGIENPFKTISFDAIAVGITKIVINGLSDSRIGTKRIAPGQVRNPFKGYDKGSSWLQAREQITFVDAGIDYNIPIRPLMRPDRNVKLIFIGDASSDAIAGGELAKMLNDIERVYKVKYEKVPLISGELFQVYRTVPEDDISPLIVYFHFFPNEEFIKKASTIPELRALIEKHQLSNFSMEKCVEHDFCGTFNFAYNTEQFNQLTGVSELVVKAYKQQIKEIINDIVFKQELEIGG
ncbi:MAG TPA: hypothetical protein VHO47_03575 [Candidatus Babeliales bacterium]|nr:hypothetical protein [Candidatus Babeliales bacterium]